MTQTPVRRLSYGLYIDGQWTDGSGADVLSVVNPATEEEIGTVPQGTVSDVQLAIRAARCAFDDGPWPQMSPRQRSEALSRMAQRMLARYDELVNLSIAEAGSTRALADSLQSRAAYRAFRGSRRTGAAAVRFRVGDGAAGGSRAGQGVVLREPAGVAALITAYNFPLFLNLFKIAPALAAGCTAVLNPSPYTPLEALVLGEIATEADLPPGVLNVVTGDVDAGRELTSNPMVDVVSFTGSEGVGRLVNRQAADTFKRVVLELGGKSANVDLRRRRSGRGGGECRGGLHRACRTRVFAAHPNAGAPVASRRTRRQGAGVAQPVDDRRPESMAPTWGR